MKTILYGIVIVLMMGMSIGTVHAREVVIISHERYPAESVTPEFVKEIYLGKKTKEGPLRIQPINQKESAIRDAFLRNVLRMSNDSYINYWFKKVYAEGGVPPKVKQSSREVIEMILAASEILPRQKGSSKEVIRHVQETIGAIGYVWKEEAVGVDGIKVLLTVDAGTAPH